MDFIKMHGRHIFVSGASSGIGQRTAITLSELGSKVTIISRREDKLQETLSKMKGEGHAAYAVDLSDVNSLEERISKIIAERGKADGYVHSAGTVNDMPLKLCSPERLDHIMKINFGSWFEMVRIMSKRGRYNKGMSIVGISSVSVYVGAPAHAAYGAAKAAMNGSMRSLSRELGNKGIRLNAVLPGPTDTEMYRGFLELKHGIQDNKNESGGRSERNYLGMNQSSDVANAVIFLLSPISEKITGVELPVDGGYMSC